MLVLDSFCGAGGASIGIGQALRAPDIAINHDPHAIAMHELNHPQTRHYKSDVWAVSPAEATRGMGLELAWFSPDCKHFSRAKGSVPVEKKIRDLAWVAVRWMKETKPGIILLENVPEFIEWGPLKTIDSKTLPDPERKGETFKEWVQAFRDEGYSIDWRELCAADFGVPTIRKRLFVVARRDGAEIEWPAPTHSRGGDGGLKPWVGAHTVIDWSIPCPSIFQRRRPLADNTCRRIAHGVVKYVLNNPQPFITQIGQTSSSPGSKVRGMDDPLSTITTKNSHLLVSAFIAKHYGGTKQQMAADIRYPFPTITQRGTQNQLVTVRLDRQAADHNRLIAPFIVKYYSSGGQWQTIEDPLHTIPTKGRFGLVSCQIGGEPWVITDIGMRMLEPHELAAAQGFPADYKWEGTKTEIVARIGNSVVPELARVLVESQLPRQPALCA